MSCAFEVLLVPDLNYPCLNLSGYSTVLLVLNGIFETLVLYLVQRLSGIDWFVESGLLLGQ